LPRSGGLDDSGGGCLGPGVLRHFAPVRSPIVNGSSGGDSQLSSTSRVLAVISQLSMFGCQVVLAAVLRFTIGRHDAYVRGWATQALNLQLALLVPWLALAAIAVQTQWGVLGAITVAYFGIVGSYCAVVGIIGAVKAWHGDEWEYPINLLLVRGWSGRLSGG